MPEHAAVVPCGFTVHALLCYAAFRYACAVFRLDAWLRRPAAKEAMDDSTAAIGIPAYVPMASREDGSGAGLFFVSVHVTMCISTSTGQARLLAPVPVVADPKLLVSPSSGRVWHYAHPLRACTACCQVTEAAPV